MKWIGIGILSGLAAFACGQDDDFDTARPNFSDPAKALPVGRTMLESGVSYMKDGSSSLVRLPELLLRHSPIRRLELQVAGPSFFFANSGARKRGWGDTGVAGLVQIGPWRSWDLAVEGMLSTDTGQPPFTSGSTDGALSVNFAGPGPGDWRIAGEARWNLSSAFKRRISSWSTVIGVNRSVNSNASVFVEYAGDYASSNRPSHFAHFGMTQKLDSRSQADVHFGFGLSRNSTDFLIGVGYSIRF